MCLAIPGQVLSIVKLSEGEGFDELWGEVLFTGGALGVEECSPGTASGVIRGVRRRVNLSYVPDITIGDYVIVHAGFAISQLDQEEAEATLLLFDEEPTERTVREDTSGGDQ